MKDNSTRDQEGWKALLSQINQYIRTQGITEEALAEKIGFRVSTVGRILHASFSPKLVDVLTICKNVGLTLKLEQMDWIEIDISNLPEGEVLAANFGTNYHPDANKKLTGKLILREGSVICESDTGVISDVTHYIIIPKKP